MVSYCKLPDVRSFVLEVRSCSGNDFPVNLYQMNVILCLDKKDKVPRHLVFLDKKDKVPGHDFYPPGS